jgi:hypothetical protein
VIAADISPISITLLSRILKLDKDIVEGLIAKLNSLAYDSSGVVRFYHPSFLDYIHAKESHNDNLVKDRILAGCIDVFDEQLRFNICRLKSSSDKNQEIEDLSNHIQKIILDELQYACYHWIGYFRNQSGHNERVKSLLHSDKILFWMEIFSVIGEIDLLLDKLNRLYHKFQEVSSFHNLV